MPVCLTDSGEAADGPNVEALLAGELFVTRQPVNKLYSVCFRAAGEDHDFVLAGDLSLAAAQLFAAAPDLLRAAMKGNAMATASKDVLLAKLPQPMG